MPDEEPNAVPPGAFCRVVRRKPGGEQYYVVHTESPRFVVEMESSGGAGGAEIGSGGVIKRVCVSNHFAGEYHRCARLLGAAVAFFESPPVRPSDSDRMSR